MGSKSDIVTDDTRAAEVGTIVHEGREFSAGGFNVDVESGRMIAYVHEVAEPFDAGASTLVGGTRHRVARFTLQTWGGETLTLLYRTGTSRGWYGAKLEHFYTARPIAGFYWYGKGLGAGMVLKLRRGRKAS